MAGKLKWLLEVEGVQQVAQKLKSLDAVVDQIGKPKGVNLDAWLKATQGNMSKSFMALNPQLAGMFQKSASTGIEKGIGDGIKKSSQGSGKANWSQFFMGIMTGMFSPWIGARMISGSGVIGAGKGGGKGGGGGITGAMFGQSGPMGFGESFIGLEIVTRALSMAFQQLKTAVDRGSQLFLRAASLGIRPTRLAAGSIYGRLLGIGEDQMDNLLAQARFMRGHTIGASMGSTQGMRVGQFRDATSMGGLQMAAQSIGDRELINRIRNLKDMTKQYERTISELADAQGRSAKSILDLKMKWTMLMETVTTEFMKLAAIMDVLARVFEKLGGNQFLKIAMMAVPGSNLGNPFNNLFQMLSAGGLIKEGDKGLFRGGAGTTRLPANEMQRLGFVFNGAAGVSTDYARQTAHNTSQLVRIISRRTPGGMGMADTPVGTYSPNINFNPHEGHNAP